MKVVIIGNGIGGFSAATKLRHLDFPCEITIISAEPYPLYSACVLPSYISGEIPRERTFVKSIEDYEKLGVHALFGEQVKEIDPIAKRVFTERGETLSFDKLILATGSEPVVFGERKRGMFKLKTLKDADDILKHGGKKAVVIGAGPIGIEIGIALFKRGHSVSMIEMMEDVLPLGLDVKGASKVRSMLEERGIEVFIGERSEEALGKEEVEGIKTNKRELECDTLIWAVGMRPRVELAKQGGIEVGEKGGIRVNSHMETSIPDIYACGDCVESHDILTGELYPNLFWHNANQQGTVVARNCTGLNTDYLGSQSILSVDVFGNYIAGFGFTEAALNRFKGIKAFDGKVTDISIIEREKNGTYYRLVIVGDRCMGAQFINVDLSQRAMGLIWSLMLRKRSVEKLLKILGNEEFLCHKPWLRRLYPFFYGGELFDQKGDRRNGQSIGH
jgi:NADH oxidase (H2O2-forming)